MKTLPIIHMKHFRAKPEIPAEHIVKHANGVINSHWPNLRRMSTIGFGQQYTTGAFHPGELIIHRAIKSWQEPDDSTEELRSKKTYSQWIAGEKRAAEFIFSPSPENRWVLMRASCLLYKWLRDFKPSNVIDFTAGESYVSARGNVSLRQKLLLQSHWTVSYKASDAACDLIWNCRALRTMAYQHLADKAWLLVIKASLAWNGSPKDLFVQLLQRYVLIHVCGSRYAEVPKNNDINRVISVGPTFDMLLQRQIGIALRSVLQRLGNDLELGQNIHRLKIASPDVATVDWKNASDSHLLAQFRLMFPPAFVHMVELCRSTGMKHPDGTEELLYTLSSMGNGFTFEVMTILLLSVARVQDPHSTVYGDDVIVSNTTAESYISACESLGWVLNKDKTFINSPFRESCGAFYHDDFGYLKSFDITWCKNLSDVFTTCNKLLRLIEWLDGMAKTHSSQHLVAIRQLLSQTWEEVSAGVPASYKGPVILPHEYMVWKRQNRNNGNMSKSQHVSYSSSLNDSFLECTNYVRSQRRNDRCQRRFLSHRKIQEFIFDRYGQLVVSYVVTVSQVPTIANKIRGDLSHPCDIYSVVNGVVDDCNGLETKNQFQVYAITEEGQLISVAATRAAYRLEFLKHCGPPLLI